MFIGVEVRVECGSCQLSQPIGALLDAGFCQRCEQSISISPERWAEILDPAITDGPVLPEDQEKWRHTADSAGIVRYRRSSPRCTRCQAEVPAAAALDDPDQRLHCVGCGYGMTVRPTPDALKRALPAVVHVVGEDEKCFAVRAAAHTANSGAVALKCPSCGGDLSPGSDDALISCGFCRASVLLPHRLPKTPQNIPDHRFYLRIDVAAATALVTSRQFLWYRLHGISVGADGLLYGLAEAKDDLPFNTPLVLFCMKPDRLMLWLTRGIEAVEDPKLSVTHGGIAFLWSERKSWSRRFRLQDGGALGRFGGQETEGATVHHFDLRQCTALTGCPDGTTLAVIHGRLVRYASDGTGIATWPERKGFLGFGGKEKLAPLYPDDSRREGRYVEEVKSYPTHIQGCDGLVTDKNGRLYMHAQRHVACFDPSGELAYRAELPSGNVWDIGVDDGGCAYSLRGIGNNALGVYRISRDGKRASLHIDGSQPNNGIRGAEYHLGVFPDGSLMTAGYDTQLRHFDASGRLVYRSETSIGEDESQAKKLAEA